MHTNNRNLDKTRRSIPATGAYACDDNVDVYHFQTPIDWWASIVSQVVGGITYRNRSDL